MANKIFKEMLNPQRHLTRNGFDRSYLHNFTAKIGELLPVMCVETVPNSHYEIRVADLMRSVPMESAAFVRANQHFEFYFVPYKQLWRKWDDFYTARGVPMSAGDSLSAPAKVPVATAYDLLSQFEDSVGAVPVNMGDINETIGKGCDKIAGLLGYPNNKMFADGRVTSAQGSLALRERMMSLKPNLFRAAAYQKICFDYYRQPFYDLPKAFTSYTYNLDDADPITGYTPSTVNVDGNTIFRYARMFQMHYRQWKKDLFTGVLPDTQFGAVAVVSTGGSDAVAIQQQVTLAINGIAKTSLLDYTGNPVGYTWSDDYGASNQPLKVGTQTSIGQSYSAELQSLNNNAPVFIGNRPADPGIKVQAQGDASLSGNASGTIDIPSSGTGSFNVLSLVRAQALQRWREITMRSGFRNVNQYEGHFGVRPIYTEKDRCVFIDSVTSPFEVNSVLNTNAGAQIDGTKIALGDMGANGKSVIASDKTIKFDAKDFGVIMCIYSMLPEATYNDLGIDFMNQKTSREEFFVPEFENIGMQPVSMDAFQLHGGDTMVNGYAARYYEYKVGIDKQSIEFVPALDYQDGIKTEQGLFAQWSPSRTISVDWQSSGIISPAIFARNLYVSPAYFKDIFTILPYEVDPEDPYAQQRTVGDSAYDSFMHQCYFDIKCVQPMSVLGLPNY